jgi:CheY-like chemotaxis protein
MVVDGHAGIRELLVELLGAEPGLEIVASAATGVGAIELADRLQPDVIVVDPEPAEVHGPDATRQILAQHPRDTCPGSDRSAARDARRADPRRRSTHLPGQVRRLHHDRRGHPGYLTTPLQKVFTLNAVRERPRLPHANPATSRTAREAGAAAREG